MVASRYTHASLARLGLASATDATLVNLLDRVERVAELWQLKADAALPRSSLDAPLPRRVSSAAPATAASTALAQGASAATVAAAAAASSSSAWNGGATSVGSR